MIADINRWVLLAALAVGQAATPPLAAHAQSNDRMEESVGDALTDALIPYAQRDYGRALALLAPLAEHGNAVAQLKLGIIFSRGIGELYLGHQNVPRDFAVARSWFLRGAQVGHSPSMYNLGIIYALGHGVAQDEIEAFKWLELAADTGVGEDRDRALRARSRLAERLTPVEVSWAASRVEDWSRAHLPMSVLASARKP